MNTNTNTKYEFTYPRETWDFECEHCGALINDYVAPDVCPQCYDEDDSTETSFIEPDYEYENDEDREDFITLIQNTFENIEKKHGKKPDFILCVDGACGWRNKLAYNIASYDDAYDEPLALLGEPRNYDRSFKVEYKDGAITSLMLYSHDSPTGESIEFIPLYIPQYVDNEQNDVVDDYNDYSTYDLQAAIRQALVDNDYCDNEPMPVVDEFTYVVPMTKDELRTKTPRDHSHAYHFSYELSKIINTFAQANYATHGVKTNIATVVSVDDQILNQIDNISLKDFITCYPHTQNDTLVVSSVEKHAFIDHFAPVMMTNPQVTGQESPAHYLDKAVGKAALSMQIKFDDDMLIAKLPQEGYYGHTMFVIFQHIDPYIPGIYHRFGYSPSDDMDVDVIASVEKAQTDALIWVYQQCVNNACTDNN